MVEIVYQSPSPFRKAASLTRIVAEAASAGDSAARRILTEAGEFMAIQTQCLIDRFIIPEEDFRLVCCGGAWKSHPLMFESFCGRLGTTSPGVTICKPRFDQIVAGPAYEALSQMGGAEDEANLDGAMSRLAQFFPEHVIRW
jgi:N-acetylglucosamine kinase-like BadF-type ATPase